MTIKELKEKRANLLAQARQFADEKTGEDGLMSAEDNETFGKMKAQLQEMSKNIKDFEALEKAEKELNKVVDQPIVSDVDNNKKTGIDSEVYSVGFQNLIKSNFESNKFKNEMSEGSDTHGGYLVPKRYADYIIEMCKEMVIMEKLGSKIITNNGNINIPIQDSRFKLLPIAEGGEYQKKDWTYGNLELKLKKQGGTILVSEELLEDSAFNFDTEVMKNIATAIVNTKEDDYLNGDGSNVPAGIFDATKGGIPYDTLTSALTADDIIKLVHSLKVGYRKRAQIITSDSVALEMALLKDNEGRYLWQPSLTDDEPDRFNGYKVNISDFAPVKKIAFGDFGYYKMAEDGKTFAIRLNELYRENGKYGFQARIRIDGALGLREACKILTLKADTTKTK